MRTETLNEVRYNYVTKKKKDLTVSMVYITPEIAKHYLSYNTKNRTKSEKTLSF